MLISGLRLDIMAAGGGGCTICFFFVVFRIFWRDFLIALRVACSGLLRFEAEPRVPEGRLLPHISAGWDRIAASQRRRPVRPLRAGGADVCWAAVAPLGGRRGGFSGDVWASPSFPLENLTMPWVSCSLGFVP